MHNAIILVAYYLIPRFDLLTASSNLVMITGGKTINQTFGVALGIFTMMAAGFEDAVNAVCARLNLLHHNLSEGQMNTDICVYGGPRVHVLELYCAVLWE